MQPTIEKPYVASEKRYDDSVMKFRRCGDSGLVLPALSLGFWWNFGAIDPLQDSKAKMFYAFDNGIYCFDLANNYGPPYGSAEETFGQIYKKNFVPYRHELVVTTKAGYDMWEGPNGKGSSRKMLLTSLDESLKRMNLDYVDIFYSHRYDGITPIEETMQALADAVRQGKALYVGLSNYPIDRLKEAVAILKELHAPCILYQGRQSMLSRDIEKEILPFLEKERIGYTAFSPLAKGLLSDKYLNGIPLDSRAALKKHFNTDDITPTLIQTLKKLNDIANSRSQSLAQMAVSWLLAQNVTTSVILGPRTLPQLKDLIKSVEKSEFTIEETEAIENLI